MHIKNALLVDAAMILALILIGVIGYKLSPLLLPKADVFVTPDPGCDLHRMACAASLPEGGRLSLTLSPQPIPVTESIDIRVNVNGVRPDRVRVDFAGVDMSMGFNRQTLLADGEGWFSGHTTLPVCVTGRMLWQATVLVDSGSRRVAVPFRFEAGH
jgi:hypothetical protein